MITSLSLTNMISDKPKFQIISTYGATNKNGGLQVNVPYWANTEFDTIELAEDRLREKATAGLKYLIVPVWEDISKVEFKKLKPKTSKK